MREGMGLVSGDNDPEIGGIFFFLLVGKDTYLWEDGLVDLGMDPKWCKWPPEWEPRQNEPCSIGLFEKSTGQDFEETLKRDVYKDGNGKDEAADN